MQGCCWPCRVLYAYIYCNGIALFCRHSFVSFSQYKLTAEWVFIMAFVGKDLLSV